MHQLMNLRNRDSKSLYYLSVGMGGGGGGTQGKSG